MAHARGAPGIRAARARTGDKIATRRRRPPPSGRAAWMPLAMHATSCNP
jgi:hypothetical protein